MAGFGLEGTGGEEDSCIEVTIGTESVGISMESEESGGGESESSGSDDAGESAGWSGTGSGVGEDDSAGIGQRCSRRRRMRLISRSIMDS